MQLMKVIMQKDGHNKKSLSLLMHIISFSTIKNMEDINCGLTMSEFSQQEIMKKFKTLPLSMKLATIPMSAGVSMRK
ncbi:hypothetical protein DRO29_05290 [Candidatus Bathyarchaeota archaeon]|nr:MAG: hypothetical protein DRO29_05290 [Candidatus Bathyarchaeota archaeon]